MALHTPLLQEAFLGPSEWWDTSLDPFCWAGCNLPRAGTLDPDGTSQEPPRQHRPLGPPTWSTQPSPSRPQHGWGSAVHINTPAGTLCKL